MWPEPLLASGFNRGKTAPGGGRGSRSPPHHAVFVCPLSASLRLDILGPDPTPLYLFHMDKGAAKLVTFLLASNSLLRPLPPCPDPL